MNQSSTTPDLEAAIKAHENSEPYRLGYDVGYEAGWQARLDPATMDTAEMLDAATEAIRMAIALLTPADER